MRLRHRDAEEARLRERVPGRLVEPLVGGLQRLETIVGRVVGEDLLRELAQGVLVFGVFEIHGDSA